MAAVYFETQFPAAMLQRTLGTASRIWQNTCPYRFKLQETNAKWNWTQDSIVFSGANLAKQCHTATDGVLGIHWTSELEKLVAFDFDWNPNASHCTMEGHPPGETWCPICWNQLIELIRVTIRAVSAVLQQIRGTCGQQQDFLLLYSGNRGVHMYLHPQLGLQFASTRARTSLFNSVLSWIRENHGQETHRLAMTTLDPAVTPSSGCEHTLRFPFSPHPSSKLGLCVTPFRLVLQKDEQQQQQQSPEHFAICYKLNPLNAEENLARVNTAAKIFEDWLSPPRR